MAKNSFKAFLFKRLKFHWALGRTMHLRCFCSVQALNCFYFHARDIMWCFCTSASRLLEGGVIANIFLEVWVSFIFYFFAVFVAELGGGCSVSACFLSCGTLPPLNDDAELVFLTEGSKLYGPCKCPLPSQSMHLPVAQRSALDAQIAGWKRLSEGAFP